MEGRQESGEHGRDCAWGLVEASFGRLRSRHGEACFGCARGVSLERRKECVGRRSGEKKCYNGRESVKSVFEEVEWRALLKRFWGAKEPGRREEVFTGQGGVGGKGSKEEWVTGGCGEGISVGCLENAVKGDGNAVSWWDQQQTLTTRNAHLLPNAAHTPLNLPLLRA